MTQARTTAIVFLGGLLVGLAAYHGVLAIGGKTPVSRETLEMQRAELAELRQENAELTEELFAPRAEGGIVFSRDDLPYDEDGDAETLISNARAEAKAEGKFLMVTFGANWCLDCRTLHYHLNNPPVADYARDLFLFVNVDVGKLNQNRDIAESLGVSLSRGIPVAIVFDPEGELIGTTNDGQLEPARHYSSMQILKFVRDIAERNRIVAPDDVS